MAKDDKVKAAGAESGGLKQKLAPMMKMLFIVLNLITMGAGAGVVYTQTMGYVPVAILEEQSRALIEAERKAHVDEPVVFTMDEITVNLDGRPKRMLQVELNIEMLDSEGFEELVRLAPEAKDELVKLLTEKSHSEIETIQGKLFLKDQVATTLNHFLDTGVVRNVYFGKFVVQ